MENKIFAETFLVNKIVNKTWIYFFDKSKNVELKIVSKKSEFR